MLTGRELFEMYVAGGLCVSTVYEWDKLSDYRRVRWCEFAEKLEKVSPLKAPYDNQRRG